MKSKKLLMLAPTFLAFTTLVGCKTTVKTVDGLTASCNKSFKVGDVIKKEDIKVTVTYSDKTTNDVTNWGCPVFGKETSYTFTEGGKKDFDIYYGDKNTTISFDVEYVGTEVNETEWKTAVDYITAGYGDGRNFKVVKMFKEKESDVEFIHCSFRVANSLFEWEGFTNVGTIDEPKIEYYKDHSFQNEFGTFSFGENLNPWCPNDGEKNVNLLQIKNLDEVYNSKGLFEEFKYDSTSKSYKRNIPEKITNEKYVNEIRFNNDKKIEKVNYVIANEYEHILYYSDVVTYGNAKEINLPKNDKFINATIVNGTKLTTDAFTIEQDEDYIFTFDLSLLKAESITSAKFYALNEKDAPIDEVIVGWFDLYKSGIKLKVFDGEKKEGDYNIEAVWDKEPMGIKSASFVTLPTSKDKLVFNFYGAKLKSQTVKLCVEINAK